MAKTQGLQTRHQNGHNLGLQNISANKCLPTASEVFGRIINLKNIYNDKSHIYMFHL